MLLELLSVPPKLRYYQIMGYPIFSMVLQHLTCTLTKAMKLNRCRKTTAGELEYDKDHFSGNPITCAHGLRRSACQHH